MFAVGSPTKKIIVNLSALVASILSVAAFDRIDVIDTAIYVTIVNIFILSSKLIFIAISIVVAVLIDIDKHCTYCGDCWCCTCVM